MAKQTKKNLKRFLLPALGFLFLVFFILDFFVLKPSQTGSVKSLNTQNVPELSGILSSSQEVRLKSTRALAERVGVETALEIVKNSRLPATGEGHLAVHQIGFVAFEKYGKDAILHCKDYFLNACYHGAIIEAASQGGFEVIGEMAARCKPVATRYFQCAHASGHAILAIWNYDLPNALKTCDQIFEKEAEFPDILTSCHNGAFMENLFGVHDWGTNKSTKRDWLKNDNPYFPCTAFGEKYQKGCWLNQAARIYQLNKGDLVKTAADCEKVPNEQHKTWCFDNLARQIHPLTEGNIGKVFNLCKSEGTAWEENCIFVNAIAYASVGDPATGVDICNAFNGSDQINCLTPVVNYFLADNIDLIQKANLCRRIRSGYVQECLSKIH